MRRCFELIGGQHQKFWVCEIVGTHYLATFGRIGTNGQTQVKTFKTASEATRKALAMIDEKTGKGYVEVRGDQWPGASETLLASLGGSPTPTPKRSAAWKETAKTSRQINLDE